MTNPKFNLARYRALSGTGRQTDSNVPEPSCQTGSLSTRFSGSVVSDVGRLRPNNEDNYVLGRFTNSSCARHSEISATDITSRWHFAGVFDGMGGGEAGELAAKAASEIFSAVFNQLNSQSSREQVDQMIHRAFQEANNRVLDLKNRYQVLGTTGTLLCASQSAFKIYHLGDSRAYLLRDKMLYQLTRDQTLAQMKLEMGVYRPNDPRIEPDKHKLTEFIGKDWTRESLVPAETQWNAIEPGDCILLCSDGLYDMCTDAEILKILQSEASLKGKTAQLVSAANRRGGVDNITCILIAFL